MDKLQLLKAAGLMSFGMLFIPVGDTAGKFLTAGGVSPVFVAWSRFAIGAIALYILMGMRGFDLSILRDWRVWFRGMLLTLGVTCILTALKTEPIANVFAAFFIGPILSYFLAAWVLKETISTPRTILLFLGFLGVLLVVKPGLNMSTGMLWALIAGTFYGSFLVATKWLIGIANPRSLLLSQLIVGSVVLVPFGATSLPEFTPYLGMLVVISALASAIGNLLYVIATRMADASRLSPLVYVQLVSATVTGVVFFKDWPDNWTLFGLILLLSSGFGGFFVKNKAMPAQR